MISLVAASRRPTADSSTRTRRSGKFLKKARQSETATAKRGATSRRSCATSASRAREECWQTSGSSGGTWPYLTGVLLYW